MKKKVIAIFLSSLVLMQTAFATAIPAGEYQSRPNLEINSEGGEVVEEQFYVAASAIATVMVAAFAAGYQIGKDLAGGYQDELDTTAEDVNYDELDFAKFDAE